MGGRSPFVPDLDERWQYARRSSLPPLPALEDNEPSRAWAPRAWAPEASAPDEPLWPAEPMWPAEPATETRRAPRAPRYGGYDYDAGRAAAHTPAARVADTPAGPRRRGLLAPDAPWRAEAWRDARGEMSDWPAPLRPGPARRALAWQAPARPTPTHGAVDWDSSYGEAERLHQAVWEADTFRQPRVQPRATSAGPAFSPADSPTFSAARARAASASRQIAAWGTSRPVVRVPADRRGVVGLLRRKRGHIRTRRMKLPPVWALVNLLILLVAGVVAAPHVFAAQSNSCLWYSVAPGDTLWGLALEYQTSVGTLADANQLANPNLIFVGQRLCIPSQAVADTVIAAPHPTTPHPVAPAVTATPAPPASKTNTIHGPSAFIKFALPYAKRAHTATGWPVSVILAQWGLEHGWKLPSFTGYNWGNVAAIAGEPVIPGTQAKGSPAHFAYAPTPEDGLRQYVRVAHLSWYRPVTAAAGVSADKAALALGASPWDAGHYGGASSPGSSLLRIMGDYNLYQYDK